MRRNELGTLVGLNSEDPASWAAGRQWMVANFPAVSAKLGNGAGVARMYAGNMCSAEEATQVTSTWGERLRNVEGVPRALAQTVESINLCAALKARHAGGLD